MVREWDWFWHFASGAKTARFLYNSSGTKTGRLSAKEPNLANTPKSIPAGMDVKFKIKTELRGAHFEVRVFSGPDADHLALNGTLRFSDIGRWSRFLDALSSRMLIEGREDALYKWRVLNSKPSKLETD